MIRIATDPANVINYGVLVEAKSGDKTVLLLVFGCRNCGKPHVHGWPKKSEVAPQHRVSHCLAPGAQDYFIAPIRSGRRPYVVQSKREDPA